VAAPHYTAVSENRLLKLIDQTGHTQNAPAQGLDYLKYYAMIVPASASAGKVAESFQPLVGTELDYAIVEVRGSGASPAEPLESAQKYWNIPPTGICRTASLAAVGSDGSNVTIGVLGLAYNAAHPENFSTVQHIFGSLSTAAEDIAHGNATLGILCAPVNLTGIVGAATNPRKVLYASALQADGTHDIANALLALIDLLGAGDVLCIELETAAGGSPKELWHKPVEISDSVWQMIRLATALGIAVVEPAGNGDADLDDPSAIAAISGSAAGYRAVSRTLLGAEDSQAVLVGASRDTDGVAAASRWTGDTGAYGEALGSNYGSRLDCFGPGQSVCTCWHNAGVFPYQSDYWGSFNGTSSATAIVGAATLLLSSIAQGVAGLASLSTLQLRWLLSDAGNNSLSYNPSVDRIGVMPDLCAIRSVRLSAIPELYSRDYAGDTGLAHGDTTLSSPDIILWPASAGDVSSDFAEGGILADAVVSHWVLSEDLNVFVRVKNRGTADAASVSVTVSWSDPDTMISASAWTPIGSATIAIVPAGDTLTCAPAITWKKESFPTGKKVLFLAVVNHASDPAPALPLLTATEAAAVGPASLLDFLKRFTGANNSVAMLLCAVGTLVSKSDAVLSPSSSKTKPGDAKAGT